jgi:hypothetical protein
MNLKRILGLALVLCALGAIAVPVSGYAADNAHGWTIYARPGVRFGTDDRTLFIMDFLVQLYRDDRNILFFNPKFTPDDQDGFETNLGVGYRRLLFADRVIAGGNVFYDHRRTGWGSEWNQVGVGAEAMAEFNRYAALTGRFNYYFPLTEARVSGGGGGAAGYFFRTGGIWTSGAGGGTVEEAPEGFDGEVGVRVPIVSDYVETWVYVGGYHYHGSHVGTIDGVSARLEILPTDFVRLSYEYRNDRTTHGDHHGEVAFEVPFSIDSLCAGKNPFKGLGRRLKGSRDMKERMVEPVRRDVDIRVVHGAAGGGVGGDTLVEDVVFVSETGDDTDGDGSFENPFKSIGRAVAAIHSGGAYAGVTTIHVMNDSDTETAGGGTADLASLMIWGSGQPHPVFGTITNQLSGYPTVADELILGGGAVDVFGTTYTGTNGITVNGADANIHHNYFSGNDWGIQVNSGSAAITDNLIGGGLAGLSPMGRCGIYADGGAISSISRNTIDTVSNGGGYGIYFYNLPSVASTAISENSISVDDTMGTIAAGIFFSTCGPISNTAITSNTIGVAVDNTGYAYGIGAVYGTGDYGLEIAGNRITVSGAPVGAWGIDLEAPAGSISADIHDNPLITVSGSGNSYGINLKAYHTIYARITGNDLSGGISGSGVSDGVYGISLITDPHPVTEIYDIGGIGGSDLLIANNNLGGAGVLATGVGGFACGIDIHARSGNLYALASNGGGIIDNTVIANASDLSGTDRGWAYGIFAETREDLAATITGGSVTSDGLGAWGIGLVADLGDLNTLISVPTINATGTGAYANGYEADGIYLEAGNMDADVAITDTDITVSAPNSFAYGISASAWYDLTASVSGGTIGATGRGARGIEFVNSSGAMDVDISVPTISVTGTNISSSSGSLNTYDTTGILLSSTSGTIDATVTDTAITATGTMYSRTKGINASGSGNITALISGGRITSTGRRAEGIYLGTTGTGSIIDADISNLTLTVTGTNTDGSGANTYATGIYLDASTRGIIDATLIGNDVTVSNTSSFSARGIYGIAYGNIVALISGGRISTTAGGATGISFETSSPSSTYPSIGNIDVDISVPTIISTGGGNGIDSYGISIKTNGTRCTGNIDADIHGITGMTVGATYGLARGISIESGGNLTGAVYGNTMTVTGMRSGTTSWFPTGVLLRANTDVGSLAAPFLIYGNSMTVTNINPVASPQRDAYGFTINYGSSTNHDVYARIYNNTLTVTGGSSSGGYGAIGGYIRANNLIGYNGTGSSSVPTVISGNTLTLNSNVAALGFYVYRYSAPGSPGNGNYVDFNNATYGGVNTITGSNGLNNTSSFSMGHPGYWCNFYWGTGGTFGSGQDYIHF